MKRLILIWMALVALTAQAAEPACIYFGQLAKCLPSAGILVDANKQIRYAEATANGTNYVAVKAPASLAADFTLTLPAVTSTVATVADKLSAFAATTSSELAGVISDETGTGSLVFGTAPTITLANGTGLPISTGVSGLGTGVATALATPSSSNLAAAVTDETGTGALVFGTAPTITLENGTGLPISTGVSGLGTGVATALATPSSANLASAITDETGTGALVFGTAPTITLGNGTGLPLSTGVTGVLDPANGGTGVANNAAATLTRSGNHALTLTTTSTTGVTLPTTGTLSTLAGTEELTNKTLTSPKVNENVALTTTATKLNYLTSATGTTGTASTNIVFSTSPTLVTPVLGAASATTMAVSSTDSAVNMTLTGRQTIAYTGAGVGLNIANSTTSGATTSLLNMTDADTAADSGNFFIALQFTGDNDATDAYFATFSDSGGTIGSIRPATATTVNFNTSSDARLKKDIEDFPDGLATLLRIQPRKYRWKEDGHEDRGFIAQELAKVYPWAVSGKPDGDVKKDPMQIDYGKLTPVLAAAIKDLAAENAALRARLDAVESRLKAAGF